MATKELALVTHASVAPVFVGDRLPAIQNLGNILSKSGYFADAREMAQAAVKVMAGEELGIAPVAAMMGINIIKGKVALSANLMAAQVRRHGYNFRVKSMDNKGCVVEFIGRKGESLGESSFTEEDAKLADIKSDMYKKYPRNMYFSRAISNGVKWYCPEVTSGLPVYTAEELGATVNGDGDVLHQPIDTTGIDTGGHPVGTQAAADHVANRKVEELKQRETQPKQKSTDYEVLKSFGKMKKDLPEKEYYRILGMNGYEHANEITDKVVAKRVYMQMLARFRELAAQQTAEPVTAPVDLPPAQQPTAGSVDPAAFANSISDEWQEGRE